MQNCPIAPQPLAQSQIVTTPNVSNLNYTNQDFWSMKSRLIDFINQRFGTSFNDFVESDIAIMLIENWAFIADTLSFKIDQIANEIFIDTVTELENAFRLALLVGFQPQPPIAASSLWTATLNNPLTTDIVLTAPFDVNVVSGNTSITIELFPCDSNYQPIFNQDIIIPAGSTVNSSIVGLQGVTYTDVDTGTGAANQQFTLSFSPVITDSISVIVDGSQWNLVTSFTESQPLREYMVQFNSQWQAFVIFGDGTAGMIPSSGSVVSITYRVGGGIVGNIVTGFAQTQTSVPVPGFDINVTVNLTNYTKGDNGYDGDTIDDIRQKLPAYLQTQNRAVTGLDYKTLTDQFTTPYNGSIGKSTAVLRNYGCAANVIDIYILQATGMTSGSLIDLEIANDDLKALLANMLEGVKMFTDYVCIKDGTIISVDATIDVTMSAFYSKFQTQYQTQISQQVASFFSIQNWEYGQNLKVSDLIKTLSNIQEVIQYDITFTTNDPNNSGQLVTALYNQIIRLDTVNIAFMYQ